MLVGKTAPFGPGSPDAGWKNRTCWPRISKRWWEKPHLLAQDLRTLVGKTAPLSFDGLVHVPVHRRTIYSEPEKKVEVPGF
jgi:hypothetical protein